MEKYLNDAKVSFKNRLLAVFTLRVAPRGRRRVKQVKQNAQSYASRNELFSAGCA